MNEPTPPHPGESGSPPAAAPAPSSRRPRWIRPAVVALLVAAAAVALRHSGASGRVDAMLEWVRGQGAWTPLLFVLAYVVATVLLVPGSALTVGAGALFGLWQGVGWVSLASTLGAAAAFLVGRHLARDAVRRRIDADPRFRAIDEAVGRDGWRIVGLTRLSPLFPYVFLNYAYGLTRVRFWPYVISSWIGMLPATVVYVYLGFLAAEGATTGTGERTWIEWTAYGLGLAATIAVTARVTQLARRALARRVET